MRRAAGTEYWPASLETLQGGVRASTAFREGTYPQDCHPHRDRDRRRRVPLWIPCLWPPRRPWRYRPSGNAFRLGSKPLLWRLILPCSCACRRTLCVLERLWGSSGFPGSHGGRYDEASWSLDQTHLSIPLTLHPPQTPRLQPDNVSRKYRMKQIWCGRPASSRILESGSTDIPGDDDERPASEGSCVTATGICDFLRVRDSIVFFYTWQLIQLARRHEDFLCIHPDRPSPTLHGNAAGISTACTRSCS